MGFPKDFLWGSATSSFQIEGSMMGVGRGECIWDRFSHTPGKVRNNENGDIACDHIHHFQDDITMMKELGINAYRFSVSWSRVLPKGTGTTSQAGLDFYNRLIDALLVAGIQPMVTLYHWDLPQALQDRGGWANPDSRQWFSDYADLMSRQLGDRAKSWITHNEPWTFTMLGNLTGQHAPGLRDPNIAYKTAHYALLSHGDAVPVIRANVEDAQVGIALNMEYAVPETSSPEDIAAAQRYDAYFNRWYFDPVFKGQYPADMVEFLQPKGALDGIDLDEIKQAAVPIDLLGLNYYVRAVIKAGMDNPFLEIAYGHDESAERTGMGWDIYPEGLKQLILRVTQVYNPPAIYITENGAAFNDPEPVNGIVEDPGRVAYIQRHLDKVSEAIDEGAPVKGYFAWSLMDNFEWAEGYAERFGIHYVNFETLERFPKRSAVTYAERIAREQALAVAP